MNYKLILGYNNLSGTIPTEIGNLKELTQIYLDNNKLSGSIPTEIGNLKNLKILLISNNCLNINSDAINSIKNLDFYNNGSFCLNNILGNCIMSYNFNNNCIPIGTLKNIYEINCSNCKNCSLCEEIEIKSISISNSNFNISY